MTALPARAARLMMLLTLLMLCGAASAGTSAPLTDADGNTVAIETHTLSRKGYIVHAWQVTNLATPAHGTVNSLRTQIEFNCRFKKARTMWISAFAARDAGGEMLDSSHITEPVWEDVASGSVRAQLLDTACLAVMR